MDNLPQEVISQILSHVSFDDRLQLSIINKNWYYGSRHPKLIQNDCFVYNTSETLRTSHARIKEIKRYKKFKKILLKTNRSILNIMFNYFYRFQQDITENIIPKIGIHIKSLYLSELTLLPDTLMDDLSKYSPNLKIFKLKNVRCVSLTKSNVQPLLNMNFLDLDNVAINDDQFKILMKYMPNLKSIGFNECEISKENTFAAPLFYSNLTKQNLLTEENIIRTLMSYKYLNSLKLVKNANIFIRLSNDIKFTSLSLKVVGFEYYLSEIDITTVRELSIAIGNNLSLQMLDLFCIPICLLLAVSRLPNLVSFKIRYTTPFNLPEYSTISSFKESITTFYKSLHTMNNIKELKVIPWDINQIKIPLTIPVEVMGQLTSLDCNIEDFSKLLTYGTNLKHLRIRNGENMREEELQIIGKNLTKLVYLRIDNCHRLKDNFFLCSPISNLKELVTLKIFGANLTYLCLSYISSSSLKVLVIDNLSLESFIPSRPLSELIDDAIICFSKFVPSLVHLDLHYLKYFENEKKYLHTKKMSDFKISSRLLKIKSHFRKLKTLKIY